MRRSWIERIRAAVRQREYDMSAHAMEEMAEDGLTILDVEEAVLTGRVKKVERDDPRGNKFVVTGAGADGETPVGVVGRFPAADRFLIVTVYVIH